MTEPAIPSPDDRDWTFVITEGCPECGFDPTFDVTRTGARVRAGVPLWQAALARPNASVRPAESVWSTTEYACHVRDVLRLFGERLTLMLTEDDARFANWDQDETALAERYWLQDPAVVAAELSAAGEETSARFDAVSGNQWQRTGTRSNGSAFTVETFAAYFLHDLEHHLHDIEEVPS